MTVYRSLDQALASPANVTYLSVYNRQLTQLPPSLGKLTYLQKLNVSHNQLEGLPLELQGLHCLEDLNLSRNFLREIPPVLWQLPTLKHLDLRNNYIQTIPHQIAALKELTHLNLKANPLTKLPENLGELTNIRMINLSDNPNLDLEQVLEVLSRLDHPFHLVLSGCRIRKFPALLGKLTNLEALTLRDSSQLQLQGTFELLSDLPQLNYLDLINTRKFLPDNIKELRHVRSLLANRFRAASDLPSHLPQLQTLYAINAHFKEIPPWILNFERLEELNLSSNRIRFLPSSLTSLQYLSHLDVSFNQIEQLPPCLTPLFIRLKSCNLEGNRHIPSQALRSFLQELHQEERSLVEQQAAAYLFLRDIPSAVALAGMPEFLNLTRFRLAPVSRLALAAMSYLRTSCDLHEIEDRKELSLIGRSKRYTVAGAKKKLLEQGIRIKTGDLEQASTLVVGEKPSYKLQAEYLESSNWATEEQLYRYVLQREPPLKGREFSKIKNLLFSRDPASVLLALNLLRTRSLDKVQLSYVLGLSFFHPEAAVKKQANALLNTQAGNYVLGFKLSLDRLSTEQQVTQMLLCPEVDQEAWVNMAYHFGGIAQGQILASGGMFFSDLLEELINYSQILSIRFAFHNISPALLQYKHIDHIEIVKSPGQFSYINQLPPVLYQMDYLKYLRLDDIPLAFLSPQMSNWKAIYKLRFTGAQITHIPPQIGDLSQLKILSVFNNRLSQLPPEIGQLHRLEELWAFSNSLHKLPKEIGQLRSLKHLHLSNNKLKHIPEEIGRLTSLEELSLSGNPLESVPSSLARLHNLQKLELPRSLPNYWEIREWLKKELAPCKVTFK